MCMLYYIRFLYDDTYRKTSNVIGTKSQNSNAPPVVLQLSMRNLLNPGV